MMSPDSCGCPAGCDENSRRAFLSRIIIGAAALQIPLAEAASADTKLRSEPPKPGDRLTHQQASRRTGYLTAEDLKTGEKQLVVVPVDPESGVVKDGSRHNRILLNRIDPALLDSQTLERSAEGIVAYSSICTHDGCAVSSLDAGKQTYMCPCHQSSFDPKAGGVLLSGPAYRPLPALPLKIEEGVLVVAAPFTARVGGGRGA